MLALSEEIGMRFMKVSGAVAAAVMWLGVSVCVAEAAPALYPTKAFDAEYERKNNANETVGAMRISSDGRGHVRVERGVPGNGHQVTFYDYKARSMTLIIGDDMDRVRSLPLNVKKLNGVSSESALKAFGAKSLGKREVEGRMCTGFEYNTAGSIAQTWIDVDSGCPVYEIASTAGGMEKLRLVKLEQKNVDSSLFAAPPASGVHAPFAKGSRAHSADR